MNQMKTMILPESTGMKKSTIIAKCLVNSNMISTVEEAENAVSQIFNEEFPNKLYDEWNQIVSQNTAESIINTVGRASRINVKSFIEDLSEILRIKGVRYNFCAHNREAFSNLTIISNQ